MTLSEHHRTFSELICQVPEIKQNTTSVILQMSCVCVQSVCVFAVNKKLWLCGSSDKLKVLYQTDRKTEHTHKHTSDKRVFQ